MSAVRKLTDAQIRMAREIVAKRKDILRQLEMYPTMEELAKDLDVSVRYLADVVKCRARITLVIVREVA